VQLPGGERAASDRQLPASVVARLPELLRVLDSAADRGEHTLSSEEIAGRIGSSSAIIRKDLSHLGFTGTRGVGYDVMALRFQISGVLGLTRDRPVALVGAGHLGRALAAYPGFAQRGFRIAAVLDSDPALVGTGIGPDETVVRDVAELEQIVAALHIRIAVLAVPAPAAQRLAERLAAAGVVSILNFAPVVLSLPEQVAVRRTDLAAELQILAFHEHRATLDLAEGAGAPAPAVEAVRG
jgi:redox-sensing transcriptional repressor